MKTTKLYDADSHLTVFTATVVACLPSEAPEFQAAFRAPLPKKSSEVLKKARAAGYAVVLDQTAFFAEGGGQAADRGFLDMTAAAGVALQQTVLDVQEKQEIIYHLVENPIPVGTVVRGTLDWEFRFTNMQQHSGEHILSGIAYHWKGYRNVGFHMGEAVTTIDFDGPFTDEELLELERRANRVVYENQPVTILYPSAEELARMDYRSKKELPGAIRIVQVGQADLCACCAPHVRETGEIGLIKIVHAENYKGGVRLSIVCGEKALKDYEEKHRALERLAGVMTTKIDQVERQTEKLMQENGNFHEKIIHLQTRLIEYKSGEIRQKIAEFSCYQENLKRSGDLQIMQNDGVMSIILIERDLDAVGARLLVSALAESLSGFAAVVLPKESGETDAEGKGLSNQDKQWHFIVVSRTRDLREMAKSLKNRYGAKGGGSREMIQGTVFASGKEIFEIFI